MAEELVWFLVTHEENMKFKYKIVDRQAEYMELKYIVAKIQMEEERSILS